MLRAVFVWVLMIFIILVVGSILLDQFPSLVPVWDEMMVQTKKLYEMSLEKFGPTGTGLLIIGIVVLIGTSASMGKRF